MTIRLALPLAATLGLAACQKELGSAGPAPTADFSFAVSPNANELTVSTYDAVQVIGKAANATNYQWDLGNDSLRTTQSPRFYYTRPGTYTLTCTVHNAANQTASVSKKVHVLSPVVQQVAIVDLADRITSQSRDLSGAVVWVVIKLGENRATYPYQSITNPSFAAPILYQSPKIPAPLASSLPYTFTVPTKLLIDNAALYNTASTRGAYSGVGYGLELYAQDATGPYLLSSSYLPFYQAQSGGITTVGTDISRNSFAATYGDVKLLGNYE